MEMIVAYMAGFILVVAAFAARGTAVDVSTLFVIALAWPLSILFAILVFALDVIGWDIDTAENTKMFGFRRPTNPNAKGFAVTLFGTEIQFYSLKKA